MSSDTSNSRRKRWQEYKADGGDLFRSHQYSDAAMAYEMALEEWSKTNSNSNTNTSLDRALLQSNLIACYLKLQRYEDALVLSTRLVSENPRWAKGHVRLASTYSALHRSNDACNSLQRALQLDPTHPTARTMLANELRRTRHHTTASTSTSNTTNDTTTIDTPIEEEEETTAATTTNIQVDQDTTTFLERIQYRWNQIGSWYTNLHSDVQSLVLLILLLLALYVVFGGRFGLQCSGHAKSTFSSSTERNNAHSTNFPTRSSHSSADYSSTNTATYTDYYSQWKKAKKQKRSFHIPNLFDGSVFSMICLATILYACQRLGIQVRNNTNYGHTK